MAPNLLVRAAFVRGELEDLDIRRKEAKDTVRTDFMLQNIFAYLLQDRYSFDAISAINKKERDVIKNMKVTIDSFRMNYASTVKILCKDLGEISEDTVGSILLGVSNELFSEGINWSRIVAYFVFVGELTKICLRSLPKSFAEVMYDNFSRLVKEKLESWIQDHNGWEGISSLSAQITHQENSPRTSNSGWGKSLLHGTVKMIGTLAQIANSTNP